MKKLFFVLFALIVLAGISNAQNKITLSAGANLALPMGSFGDAAGIGFGATIGGDYIINEKLVGTATVGYIMWGGQEIDLGLGKITTDFSAIPVLVGAKYYLNKGFYGHGQLGFHLFSTTAKSTFTFFGNTTESEATGSSSEFTIGVGAGYEMGSLDLSAGYYIISNTNYVGARVAYRFSL